MAVVVWYLPTTEMLDNIKACLDQVDRVLVVDNSPTVDAELVEHLGSLGAEHLWMGGNTGIAAALNAGCREAIARGYTWAFTLDQDSTPPPDMTSGLLKCLDEDSTHIAVIAPQWQQEGGLVMVAEEACVDVNTAMTSGNLLRMSAFKSLGGFRDDLFIDEVDMEYCMKARRAGWRVVQSRSVVLLHRMGAMERVYFPVPCYILNYSPVRRYYMVRNILALRKEFGAEFPDWLEAERNHWRKEIVKIALAEPNRLRKLHLMWLGWLDYRRGRFGKFEELHPEV